MTDYIGIISTLFLLLPGFVVIKIHQSAREYKSLSTFEYTTTSLGYSLLIFLLWIIINYSLSFIGAGNYCLLQDLKEVIISQNYEILFSKSFGAIIFSYLCSFGIVSLILYNILWVNLTYVFFRKLNLTRFSQGLTPWEDFQMISKLDWIIVELKNGKSIVGKLCFWSHSPFGKELVIKRTDSSPIQLYDSNNKNISFGPEIELAYVNIDEISTIYSVKDKGISVTNRTRSDVLYLILSLSFSIIMILLTFSSIPLMLYKSVHISSWLILLFFVLLFIGLVCNFKSLSKYN